MNGQRARRTGPVAGAALAGSASITHSPDRRSSSGGPVSGGPFRPPGEGHPGATRPVTVNCGNERMTPAEEE
jgi:hypothetical protein